jgi:hypothetical protein
MRAPPHQQPRIPRLEAGLHKPNAWMHAHIGGAMTSVRVAAARPSLSSAVHSIQEGFHISPFNSGMRRKMQKAIKKMLARGGITLVHTEATSRLKEGRRRLGAWQRKCKQPNTFRIQDFHSERTIQAME